MTRSKITKMSWGQNGLGGNGFEEKHFVDSHFKVVLKRYRNICHFYFEFI